MIPRYNEPISPVPWHFLKSRFHCTYEDTAGCTLRRKSLACILTACGVLVYHGSPWCILACQDGVIVAAAVQPADLLPQMPHPGEDKVVKCPTNAQGGLGDARGWN